MNHDSTGQPDNRSDRKDEWGLDEGTLAEYGLGAILADSDSPATMPSLQV